MRTISLVVAAIAVTGCYRDLKSQLFPNAWMSDAVPFVADVNGDGVEDFVGPRNEGYALTDGKTFAPVWSLKDQSAQIICPAGDVIATSNDRDVGAVDVKTGSVVFSEHGSDRIKNICATRQAVIFEQIDGDGFSIDLATHKRTNGVTCEVPEGRSLQVGEGVGCFLNGALQIVPIDGAVTMTIKEKGTPQITLVGHSASGAETFKRIVVERNDQTLATGMSQGQPIIAYNYDHTYVVGFDPTTGAELWRYQRGFGRGALITASRVYLVSEDSPDSSVRHRRKRVLSVLDGKTGALLHLFE